MTKNLPAAAGNVANTYPDIWKAYSNLGEACANAGPLDDKVRRLIKLALAIGAGSEGAVHSHTRRALEAGMTAEEIKQVAMLAIPTHGFPRAIAALTWIEDITKGA
jgi:AhpD family alkylhydroperoxidase